MAGHSQFKNIMVRKGRQDAVRGKVFTKIGREIMSACKMGAPDPATNPRLRAAVQWAREENMPRDKIDAAIKRASGPGEGEVFETIRYEGYGPGGTAMIVQALTDNRNRTAADVRSIFTKLGGNMGESGSVSFMFDFVGRITYPLSVASEEKMFDVASVVGAEDCKIEGEHHVIICASDQFGAVRDGLEKAFGAATSAKLTWLPKNTISVDADQAAALIKLLDALEDHDDVQEVFSNFEIAEEILQKLSVA